MHHLRAILVYLLCALLLGSGVVPRTASSCSPTGGDCAPRSCCCSKDAMAACPCRKPERQPAPRAPAPKQLQEFAIAEAEPRTDEVPAVPTPKLRPATTVIVCTGVLPRCTRQEALAVWRL
ncbi:MAG TPA: hypothetical protein VK348_13610 [Planctomycetota bacterium]|nr:hypothetical protein [Planctomycetota bacterium]